MTRILRVLAQVVLLIGIAQSVAAQSFADGTFNNASWSEIVLPSSASGATCTSTQDASNGNPSPSRKTVHVYPPGFINCAHVSLASTYTPSQGAIVALRYSYDLIHYTFPLGGVGHSPLIIQSNTYYYLATGNSATSGVWATFNKSGLTETDFIKIDGPAERDHPDFSCNGAPIQFGYLTRNHLPSGPNVTTQSAIDNWNITIESTQPCRQTFNCPPRTIPTVVNDVTYCCITPNDGPIGQDTPEFCCARACPAGSVQTTVNDVTFCCQPDALGGICCTRR